MLEVANDELYERT